MGSPSRGCKHRVIRVGVVHRVAWALAGAVVTVVLIAAAAFPDQAVAIATAALALTALGAEGARLWRDR